MKVTDRGGQGQTTTDKDMQRQINTKPYRGANTERKKRDNQVQTDTETGRRRERQKDREKNR